MKKLPLLNWILILFLSFQFTSCEDELLEGEFPEGGNTPIVEVGAFIAVVDGNSFTATTANGVLTTANFLTITGEITGTGEKITLAIENAGLGVFNITTGLGTLNTASYNADDLSNPYISSGISGTSGELEITLFDESALKISGVFNFTGIRIAVDADGNPILDGSGNLTFETVEITSGAFNQISYTIEDQGGGTPNENEFFAKVDGLDFITTAVTTTLSDVSGVSMVKIVAVNANEELIRIDIPEDMGLGTFSMEELSDGTKLIALYNSNIGNENLTSSPGTITITKFNTNTGVIEATFAFTASDPLDLDPSVHEITEGSFEIDYITEAGETVTTFTADVDGVFYNPDSILIDETFFNGFTRFSIVTLDSNTSQKMGLFFPTSIEEGTYDMDMSLINGHERFAQYTPENGVAPTFISSPGTLTIIDNDSEARVIEGTFTFTAIDQLNNDSPIYEVTTGEFTIEY